MPLYLFTGEEDILLWQELKKRKKSFLEKYDSWWFFDFPSDELNTEQIQNAVMSGGMFATKKLVIIRWIPMDLVTHNKAKQSDIDRCLLLLEQFKKTNDPETIVVCVSYKPDKRMKAYKWFQANADIKEFPRRTEKQFAAYITQQCWSFLTQEQQSWLTLSCSDSYWHLTQEIEKIRWYMSANSLTKLSNEQLSTIVRSTSESNNFDLLDHMYTNKQKSIELLTQAEQTNNDMFQFLGMLYRSLKTTINMIICSEHWITDSKQLASLLKAHPFIVSKQLKLLPILKKNKSQIITLYTNIITLDEQIKTGIYPPEWFWLRLKQLIWTLDIK
jgi:DNA polymerase III delta subunit